VVALIGSSGSSRTFRVSARIFASSSVSDPSQVQSKPTSCSSTDSQLLGPRRALARSGLVGRDAHAAQSRRVVQRLQHAGQWDRAAVRVGQDPVVLGDPIAVHLRHDERDAGLQPVRRRLVDRDRAAADGVRDELA